MPFVQMMVTPPPDGLMNTKTGGGATGVTPVSTGEFAVSTAALIEVAAETT